MKSWLIALILAAVVIVGGGFWWYAQQKPNIVSNPIDAIPESAALIISYPNINALWDNFEAQDYYESVIEIDELQRYFSRSLLLDSLIRYNQNLKEALSRSSVWSSYHVNQSDSLLVFHAIQGKGKTNAQLLKAFSESVSSAGIISNITLNGIAGFKLVVREPYYELFGTVLNGLILLSSDESLLRKSISQLKSGKSLRSDANFNDVVRVSGKKVETNIYINYSNFPAYLQRILKPTLLSLQNAVENFASWTELDLNLTEKGFVLNGFTVTNDSNDQFLSLFLKQDPRPVNFPSHLPANTASFVFYGISDLISFSADYREFMHDKGVLVEIETQLDSIQRKYGIDIEQNVLSWMGKSYGVCITEPSSRSFSDETYWIFETKSDELAKKLLTDLSKKVAAVNGGKLETQALNGVNITQLNLGQHLVKLLGDGYDDFANPFFMVVNGHVVFGTTLSAMRTYLQYLQADRTLAKELSFSRFVNNLSSTYNIFTYHQLARSNKILGSYLNRDALDAFERNKTLVNSFEALGTQISSTGSSFYSNVFLRYDPNWGDSEQSAWKCKLESEAQIVPQFVMNHVSQEYEVIVQDENNDLYLFNLVGKEIFKRQIPEAIESKIVQVDRYKNGNLQYVFNTKNFIYMLDRNGKDVDGFPVELKSQAETELSIVEYDQNRNYRFLITCKNKRIYNYEVDGSFVKGWKHNRATAPTIHPFQHLTKNKKDYLVTGESNGKIHLLDRRGKNRVKVEKYIKASKNNHLQRFKSQLPDQTGVFITDKNGLIHQVSLNGRVSTINVGKFSEDHSFLVSDLDGDKRPEFIFYDLNMLSTFDRSGDKLFEERIEPSASSPKIVELDDGTSGIAFHYKDSEQLILFNSAGEQFDGFPLSGNSQFDLKKSGNRLLVCSKGAENTVTIQTMD